MCTEENTGGVNRHTIRDINFCICPENVAYRLGNVVNGYVVFQESPTVYTPQVEAISPTLPSEDIALRATKEDLLQQINKVDREIAKTEQQIFKLKNKQRELEEVASKPVAKKEEKEAEQPKHQSPAQKIYADNRVKHFIYSFSYRNIHSVLIRHW